MPYTANSFFVVFLPPYMHIGAVVPIVVGGRATVALCRMAASYIALLRHYLLASRGTVFFWFEGVSQVICLFFLFRLGW